MEVQGIDAPDMPAGGYIGDFLVLCVVLAALVAATVFFLRRVRRLGDQEAPSRLRLLTGNALVTLCLLGSLALGAEAYLRWVFDCTTWHGGFLVTRAWFVRHENLNAWNWRDVEFQQQRPPGVQRTAFLGDSFTYGYGVDDPADRFTDRIRAALDARAPGRHEIWNCGRVGAATGNHIELLTAMLSRCDVDHVVLVYSPNDIEDLLPKARRDGEALSAHHADGFLNRLFLVNFVAGHVELWTSDYADTYFDDIAAAHRAGPLRDQQLERMRAIADICRRARTRLDVVVFPLISHWGPEYPFDDVHEHVGETWSSLGARVVDLRAAFAGKTGAELRVGAFDAHPNEAANALAADAILKALYDR